MTEEYGSDEAEYRNLASMASGSAFHASDFETPEDVGFEVKGAKEYMWRTNMLGGVDVLTFDDPDNIGTARFFRYKRGDDINLSSDTPAAVGEDVVHVLKAYPVLELHN